MLFIEIPEDFASCGLQFIDLFIGETVVSKTLLLCEVEIFIEADPEYKLLFVNDILTLYYLQDSQEQEHIQQALETYSIAVTILEDF